MDNQTQEWLATRPPFVQALAKRYPPGSVFNLGGRRMYLLGYGEYKDHKVGLVVSTINPAHHYDAALASRELLCPSCLENR